jgi:hypothetical protein
MERPRLGGHEQSGHQRGRFRHRSGLERGRHDRLNDFTLPGGGWAGSAYRLQDGTAYLRTAWLPDQQVWYLPQLSAHAGPRLRVSHSCLEGGKALPFPPFRKRLMNVNLRDIHKSFGLVRANIGINLTIPAGTIQGILGENGAGKSTLMKVLSGFIRATGRHHPMTISQITLPAPSDAAQMLHQIRLNFRRCIINDSSTVRAASLTGRIGSCGSGSQFGPPSTELSTPLRSANAGWRSCA